MLSCFGRVFARRSCVTTDRHNRADQLELFGAYVQRFREGDIGPYTFRGLCEEIGIDNDDIVAALAQHMEECARNIKRGH